MFSIFNAKKYQNGEECIGLIRAKLPEQGTIIQTIGILISPDLVLASPSSIFSFPKQIYYDDIIFQIKDDQKIKIIDHRISIEYLDGKNKIGGFALLKLQSKIKVKCIIELFADFDQTEMLDLISIRTKKTEIINIFRKELINFRVEPQKVGFYKSDTSKEGNI